tara:strand:- start:1559 stop:1825 length:267 start_codon:yes stop_codon:yes gene_type:complete
MQVKISVIVHLVTLGSQGGLRVLKVVETHLLGLEDLIGRVLREEEITIQIVDRPVDKVQPTQEMVEDQIIIEVEINSIHEDKRELNRP